MPTRQEMWNKLGGEVDVLVVGGGIVGTGVARDAVRRGLKVALVEMRDLAYGTSSRSSKLVHGGLRYLEHYEFSMVFESVSERRVLMDLAPHLVNPLGFLFPVYDGDRHNLFVINAGMWLYDGLSLFRSPRIHKNLKPKEVAEVEPTLDARGLQGAPLFYDCSTDDARLTLETALDAMGHGATIATGAKVVRFLRSADGRVAGAEVEDTLGGEERREIRAKVVVNATGPWTDRVRELSPIPGKDKRDVLRPTKGIHIVVPADKLPVKHAVTCYHPVDERVLFALPWGDRTYLGTTDTDYEGDPADVAATSEDVDYLLTVAAHYFPDFPVGREDVIATWAGLRPLVAPPTGANVSESDVSREHEILVGRDGLLTIAGGKLTTYRKMAGEVVDRAVDLLRLMGAVKHGQLGSSRTERDPLPGGRGWPDDDDHAKVAAQVGEAAQGSLEPAVCQHLANTYGMRAVDLAESVVNDESARAPLVPGRPEIVGQVDWAVNEELAATVSDVLIRRTQLFYRDMDQGLGCAEAVAERMGTLLGWDAAAKAASIAGYREDVARSRRWRAG
ncbi:MAG: glycerol-3-phosphate dehydrogenase [Sandaracinus sp.]|nr:glycerol-3-phosphate dehydrogenase [Sandaracinus sp.]